MQIILFQTTLKFYGFIYVLEVMCKNLTLTYKLPSHYINCLSGYSDNHKGTVFFWNSA